MRLVQRVAITFILLSILLLPAGETSRSVAQNVGAGPGLAWPDEWMADSAFYNVWSRGDAPVAMRSAVRSWLWGPVPFAVANEPYAESPTGLRLVTYLDKARMEVNDPSLDRASQWFITSGLLVKEMATGLMQTGNNRFEPRGPANVSVAGDLGNVTAPTYASFATHTAPVSNANGARVKEGIARDGALFSVTPSATATITKQLDLLSYDSVTGHNIPGVFFDWMRQTSTVLEGGRLVQAPLLDPLYVLGRPLTEPYWADVPVKGATVRVLVQLFERRALTYNPANPPEWQVEMANVGRSYFEWRYGGKAVAPAIAAELRQNSISLHGWNWPPAQKVRVEIDLAGGIAPLVGPQDVTADGAGRFSIALPSNPQLQSALVSGANITVSAMAGEQVTIALPFAARTVSGKVQLEGALAQVSPSRSQVQQLTFTARDSKRWTLLLDANAKLLYSEGAPVTADLLRPGMSVSVEGTVSGGSVAVTVLRLMSVSRTGATFGYTAAVDGKTLQISGKGWPGEKAVTFTLRTLLSDTTKPFANIVVDSRGNLLGAVPLPARNTLPAGSLWLFAISSDKGTMLAQVALPFDYPPATPVSKPPSLILMSAASEQTGGLGSYCWQTRCINAIGVPLPPAALQAAPGEALGLRSQYGPDPNAGLSPSKFTARIYPYPEGVTSGQATLLDGVLYFAPHTAPLYTTGELPGRPFSLALPSTLGKGKYAVLVDVTWPDTGTGGGSSGYGFVVEVR